MQEFAKVIAMMPGIKSFRKKEKTVPNISIVGEENIGTCFWEANGRRMTVSWWEEMQPSQRREEKAGRTETSRALRKNKIGQLNL